MEPGGEPLDGRAWFRANPTGAIILTGLVGGAGAGIVSGVAIVFGLAAAFGWGAPDMTFWIAFIAGFVGAWVGVVGGFFATIGSLVVRGLIRLFTKNFVWDAAATIAGAVGGIVGLAFWWFKDGANAHFLPWILLPIGLAAAGFTILVLIRRPEQAPVSVDA